MGIFSKLWNWRENRRLRAMQHMMCSGDISLTMDELGIPARIIADAETIFGDQVVAIPLPRNGREAGEIGSIVIQASIQLGMERVALAVCERPRVVFVDYNAIRKLSEDETSRRFLTEVGDRWMSLLWLLFKQGYRLAKVCPGDEPCWIWIFEK